MAANLDNVSSTQCSLTQIVIYHGPTYIHTNHIHVTIHNMHAMHGLPILKKTAYHVAEIEKRVNCKEKGRERRRETEKRKINQKERQASLKLDKN